MARMEEEADELGADGIVGVRLDVNLHAWGTNIIEFLAIGTAIRHARAQGSAARAERQAVPERPLGAGLLDAPPRRLPAARLRDGQLRLPRRPPRACREASSRTASCQGYTQALYDSRELAMERMQAEADELGAEGIVGVVVDETNHTWGSNVLEFSAVGTAVVAISRGPQDPGPVPRPHA